jgi:hypothetical protein
LNVAIAHWDSRSTGTSIRNVTEDLCALVVNRFALNPLNLLWIEHFSKGKQGCFERSLDRVTFSGFDGSRLLGPNWESTSEAAIASQIGLLSLTLKQTQFSIGDLFGLKTFSHVHLIGSRLNIIYSPPADWDFILKVPDEILTPLIPDSGFARESNFPSNFLIWRKKIIDALGGDHSLVTARAKIAAALNDQGLNVFPDLIHPWLALPKSASPNIGAVSLGHTDNFIDGVGHTYMWRNEMRLYGSPPIKRFR